MGHNYVHLKQLLFSLGYDEDHGLIKIDAKGKWKDRLQHHSFKTIEALDIIKPYAIFEINNYPFILFFDNPEDNAEAIIHNQIWCFNQAPLVFILKHNELNIYNAFNFLREEYKLEEIHLDKQQFCFWEVQSGNTWNLLQKEVYRKSGENYKKLRVDQSLIDNIKYAARLLIEKGLSEETANLLILRLIFTRYLIDRGVLFEKYFTSKNEKENKARLPEIIKNDVKLYDGLFSYLKGRFKSHLFEIGDKERKEIANNKKALIILSDLFSENYIFSKKQYVLFNDYDFKIIPVEFISSIYESIIRKDGIDENSSVYTPTYLVDYILTQTIEPFLDKNDTSTCKILDPACGSGIFLVEAYRKIVEKEASIQNKKTNQLDINTLINLLTDNIFGVDCNKNALNVTCFSLYIALLDYKEPKEIRNLKLPNLLDNNLFESDIFNLSHRFNKILQNKNINIVFGNPPWKKMNGSHIQYCKIREQIETKANSDKVEIKLGNNEIAEAFLIRLSDISPSAKYALIVTSKILYNVHSDKFRKYFLKHYFLDKVFDLSPVRFLIFEKAKNPAAIIFYRYNKDKIQTASNEINHISIKPNIYLEYFNNLVIEKYDSKIISQEYFVNYDWMWKVMLYGNYADFLLIKKLKETNYTISSFVRENKIEIGRGESFDYSKNVKETLETHKIKPYYTNSIQKKDNNKKTTNKYIVIPRRMKEESSILVSFLEEEYKLTDTTIVFKSPNETNVIFLYGLMISKLYSYFQYMTSSNWGVYRPEINIGEHCSFPIKKSISDALHEETNKIISYFRDSYKNEKILGLDREPPRETIKKINNTIYEYYEVNEQERDFINYANEVAVNIFRNNKKIQKKLVGKVSHRILESYASVFYEHYSAIYNGPEFFQIEIYCVKYFIAMNFKIVGKEPSLEERIIFKSNTEEEAILKSIAEKVSLYKVANDIFMQRDVKGFEDDSFYIIKPNETRCWHIAMARIDLSEFIDRFMKNSSPYTKLKTA